MKHFFNRILLGLAVLLKVVIAVAEFLMDLFGEQQNQTPESA
jgi:hypothetical protein